MENLQITFYLDGTGIIYDDDQPIQLDALLGFAKMIDSGNFVELGRNEKPVELDLPLEKTQIGSIWVWNASILFPETKKETIQYFRKRMRDNRIEIAKGKGNLKGGYYKTKNMPESLKLINTLTGYARGDKKEISLLLEKIKYLGKRRNVGKGRILKIDIADIQENMSIIKDGKAMKYLPFEHGMRFARIRPPYWNGTDRIYCCEIGDKYTL